MREGFLQQQVYQDLPEILEEIVSPFNGRKKDIVFLSSIGVISAALPKIYSVYDQNKVSPNLYLLVIAPPASGKGVMNYSKNLIQPVHKALIDEGDISATGRRGVKYKIIPANISSAQLYNMLNNVDDSGIMIETEADTLSVMFKNEWGNFSDVLRKAFHHESVSISRKTDNQVIQLDKPKLSLVLSGTPDQIEPLIQSRDNGLFSRFMYYKFDELSEWKNVFASRVNFEDTFLNIGNTRIKPIYEKLSSRQNELEFKLPSELEERFNEEMKTLHSTVKENHPKIFGSNLMRHGLILYRLCMILTALRQHRTLDSIDSLICSTTDFETALGITKDILNHALDILYLMGEKGLPALDVELLKRVDKTFKRAQILPIADVLNIPTRTLDDKLSKWVKEGVLKKISTGIYEKLKA